MKKRFIIFLGILMIAQFAMAEEVKIVMWQHEGGQPETDFYKQRIEAFNQVNAGKILVDLKIIPRGGGNDYEQKVNMGAAAGELPDVVDMDGPYVANFAYSKLLLPLDDLLDKNSEWFQDYVPAMLQQGTFDGKLYALGAMESSVGVYFNKKIFADLGLPEPPTSVEKAWTFDEFAAVLEQLKQKLPADVYPIVGLGGQVNEWLTYMGAPFIWANAGDLISEDGRKADGYLNSPATIDAMTKIQALFTNGYTVNDPGERAFPRGKAAMAISGPWEVIGLKEYPDVQWGLAPYPVMKTNSSPTGSWCWGVTASSKYPKEAVEVLKWMTNKDSTIGLSGVTGMLPTSKSAYQELTNFNTLPLSVFMEQQLKGAHPRPRTPAYPTLTQEFAQAWHDIIMGKDVKTALNEATAKVDRYIKRRMK